MLVQCKRKIKRCKNRFHCLFGFISLTMPKHFFVREVKKFLSTGFTMVNDLGDVALYRIKNYLCLITHFSIIWSRN